MGKLFAAEQEQSKRNDLKKLFDIQIAMFNDRGVPKQITDAFRHHKDLVVHKASRMTIGEGNISFLPVIKPAYLGYHGLMAMVRNGLKKGYTCLKPAAITDQFETSDDLYYIYDVEDGNATCGKSPQYAENIFKKQLRFSLTAAEVINLCILTDVLYRNYVWAVGSHYESAIKVLNVCLDNYSGQPILGWNHVYDAFNHWGLASCGSR